MRSRRMPPIPEMSLGAWNVDGRRIDRYLAIEGGEIGGTGVESTVGMLLIIDKLRYEIWEVGLSDFGGNNFWVNTVHCKHR